MKITSIVVAALVGGAVLASGTAAFAQASLVVERPFRIKIGGFFPTNRVTKSEVGRNFFTYGATWDFFKNPGQVTNTYYSVYFDSAGKGGSTTIDPDPSNPNDFLVDVGTYRGFYGLGVALRNYILPETLETPVNFYVGAGVGIYQFRARRPELEGNRYVGKNKTNTRFGGKFFTGAEMPQGYFGELEYTLPGESTGNGVALSVGYRF